jgi:hypothetical protein
MAPGVILAPLPCAKGQPNGKNCEEEAGEEKISEQEVRRFA